MQRRNATNRSDSKRGKLIQHIVFLDSVYTETGDYVGPGPI